MISDRTILLVEDNPDDVFIFKRALNEARIVDPVVVISNGQDAIDYLSRQGKYESEPPMADPFIIFLDLKLPYVDGFEVLEWIRKQPSLKSTAVVLLSGSDEHRDHVKASTLGAHSYLVKPPSAENLRQLMEVMTHAGRTSSDF